jgi:hypothetical protein
MEENVHIIPLGYEYDRAVRPFEGPSGFRANRVYLLSVLEGVNAQIEVREKHQKYANMVMKRLGELGIPVIPVPTNLIDILEVLRKICNIIRTERASGNNVYINMSSAGRLTSVGATLSGMVHGVRVYYVMSDEYADQDPRMETHGYTIVETPQITYLENFQISLPNELQLRVLIAVMQKKKMRTIGIIEFLRSIDAPDFGENYYSLNRSEKSRVMMKLERGILEKLEERGLIKKNRLGRESEFEVTETGRYIASISGLMDDP